MELKLDTEFPIQDIGRRVLEGQLLSRPILLSLVEKIDLAGQGPWDILYQAHIVRQENFGREVRLCSIVPGKLGNCSEDCKWCAQSAQAANGTVKPIRTSTDEICQAATNAQKLGSANIGIVNSGKKPTDRDIEEVILAAEKIAAQQGGKIGICASLGETSDNQFRRLAASPVKRYHNNLETSRRFFSTLVTTHTYDDKLKTLRSARQAGFDICSGGLFGLGETWEDRIDLALTLRDEVQPDVVPLNFLVPIAGTPLASSVPMTPMEILLVIAIFRLALPNVDIKIAGGRDSNLRDLQSLIFFAGATSFMIGNYLTTAGQTPERDLKMLDDLGLTIVTEFQPRKTTKTQK